MSIVTGDKPRVSVVVCSLNGERCLGRCLAALAAQTHDAYEVIVVDDGSTDATGAIAAAAGARIERHDVPRGLAAARNAGIRAARGAIVVFTDDDCEPSADWLEELERTYRTAGGLELIAGVGGAVDPAAPDGPMLRTCSSTTRWSQWRSSWMVVARRPTASCATSCATSRPARPSGCASALPGRREHVLPARLAARRRRLRRAVHLRLRRRGICRRLRARFPERPLLFNPDARVQHWFEPSLRDTLRRSAAYGRGNARMAAIYGSGAIVFPFPLLVGGLVAAGLRRPALAAIGVAAPLLLFPRGPRAALRSRDWVHVARRTYRCCRSRAPTSASCAAGGPLGAGGPPDGRLDRNHLEGRTRRRADARCALAHDSEHDREIVVVDASDGRLADIALAFPDILWIDFIPPAGSKPVTIPKQRNAGIASARGEVVVFVDAGCMPGAGWLDALLAPIARGDELVTVGGRYGSETVATCCVPTRPATSATHRP